MACVLLDIGAGSKTFVRRLKICNLATPILAFCGEPDWGLLNPLTVSSARARQLAMRPRRGSYRIASSYRKFAFDDASLDVVTCNAPMPPLWLPVGMEPELRRCLKTSGLFFYSYPSPRFYHRLNLEPFGFTQLARAAFPKDGNAVSLRNFIPKGLPAWFPPSPTISWNINEMNTRSGGGEGTRTSSYVYFMSGVCPTWELWRKG